MRSARARRALLCAAAAYALWIISFNAAETTLRHVDDSRGWSAMAERICPRMSPDRRVWWALIELARGQLGVPDDDVRVGGEDEVALANFFRFNAGGYEIAAPDGRRVVVILRTYKCGSTQIEKRLWGWHARYGSVAGYSLRVFYPTSALLDGTPSGGGDNVTWCTVMAIRDPVERFLSGCNEVMERRAYEVNGTEARFEKFVRDFVTGPVSNGMYRGRQEELEMTHINSMSGVLWGLRRLGACHGEDRAPRLTAYLPSLRDINTEFPKMVRDHCPPLPRFDSFSSQHRHRSQGDRNGHHAAARRAWEDGGATARALCVVHALDYACFRSVPVPAICAGVYAEEAFRRGVLRAAAAGRDGDDDACSREYPII